MKPRKAMMRNRSFLDDSARQHHSVAVSKGYCDVDVMGNEENTNILLSNQSPEQTDDPPPQRGIQRGHRLIENQQIWRQAKGTCQMKPLAFPARETAGRLGHDPFGKADAMEVRDRETGDLTATARESVGIEALSKHGLHRHPRIQRVVGILENPLDAPSIGTSHWGPGPASHKNSATV
jgi:hypothetical protein